MVKVWEQQYPGGDVTYIDESGVTHVEGAQHRQTMPDAYPLPSTAPAGVTRKTPRGNKPPTQGRGSIKQGPWRECFKKCTIRWGALPDECPWDDECPPTSSKKNVWDAKQAQGVMCAYYDLYIACCLSSCEQITIAGPKGKPVARGIISPYEGCFPCDNPSTGKVLSIAYWSQQMNVGEHQSLAAHDSVAGYSIPFCADETLHWSIVSGGGSLTFATGLSTEYHAPDTNENCDGNPTIKLTDCCGRVATLKMAINGAAAGELAVYECCNGASWFGPPRTNLCCVFGYSCDGLAIGYGYSIYCEYMGCLDVYTSRIQMWADLSYPCEQGGNPPAGISDARTPAQKASGCCPTQLL